MTRFSFTRVHACLLGTAVAAGLACLPSCAPFIGYTPPLTPYDTMGVIPQTFLFTTYGPLNQFLDTPVHVHIDEVPLDQVFDHPALQPLNYRFVRKPKGPMPLISIHQVALTRRQLLWCIAKDNQLDIIPVIDPVGTSYFDIRSTKEEQKEKGN